MNSFDICLIITTILSCLIGMGDLKGGRGGGGGFRGGGGSRFGSGGSRFGGSSGGFGSHSNIGAKPGIGGGYNYGGYGSNIRAAPGYSNYRTGGGVRWASFGSGMIAYGVMSNLASRGYYHNSGGYYRNDHKNNYNKAKGSICVNNEDFNGTVFGSFQCPLPEFDPSATYCCGENELQYCCNFTDDPGRRWGFVLAICSFLAIVICAISCVKRLMRRRASLLKFDNRAAAFTQPPINMRNINRNINTNYPSGPRPPMPPGPQQSYPPRQPNRNIYNNNHPNERAPFILNQMNVQQPITPSAPPNMINNINNVNLPPPSYSDVIKN